MRVHTGKIIYLQINSSTDQKFSSIKIITFQLNDICALSVEKVLRDLAALIHTCYVTEEKKITNAHSVPKVLYVQAVCMAI